MTVLETISKLQATDEGTARLLLELALYDAVCDEADRVGPELEAAVSKALSRQAARGLVHLAKSGSTAYDVADQLAQLVLVGKAGSESAVVTPDDPKTPFWDARDAEGKFASGGLRGRIFDVIGAATRRNADDDKLQQVGRAWSGDQADKYSRLRSLGDGLVATNDPNARPAGTIARLIGDIGPEAQRVLEPGIRRAAYRYRGTERRPDQATQQQIADLVRELQGPGQDQARLRMTSDFGAAHLISQIPTKESAAISLAAGKMPPSLGLMFNGQGRLVSEAMGFNGDHYLPFDLKNLKRLKGGSYVRTRTTGGLTDEDIYTGLLTGARHITVVSNSGVFTLEFDPDLRGGRRYSDKARQMVDRYARLVGAIGSKELMQNDVPREEQNKLRRQALIDSGAREEIVDGQKTGKLTGGHADNAGKLFQRYLQEARDRAAFMGRDDDDLMEQAETDVKASGGGHGNYASQVRERFNQLKADDAKTAARKYRLDGEGYKAAMKALKTEFPYFIRSATFLPLQDYMDSRRLGTPGEPRRPRGGTDMGYTPPRALDAAKVGVIDRTDAEGKKRKVLGYPGAKDPRANAERSSAAPAATSETSGTDAGATSTSGALGGGSTGGRRTVDTVASSLLKDRKPEFTTALQAGLRGRLQNSDQWINRELMPDNSEATDDHALKMNEPDAYADWLINVKGGTSRSFDKIAAFLLDPGTDPAHLDRTVAAMERIDQVQGSAEGALQAGKGEKAAAVVRQIKMLREPFGPAGDLYAPPADDAEAPMKIPGITDVELTDDAITEVISAPENHAARDQAIEWSKAGADPETIRRDITEAAEHLDRVKRWVADGRPANPEFAVTPQIELEADQLETAKDKAPVAEKVADLNKAWALMRMGELLGLARGANPFPSDPAQRGVGKSDSTPSRIRFHPPGSPAARALAAQRR